MSQKQIRNFSIIAHIDHGKTTLVDRMLELTQSVPKRLMREQFLDKMDLERERGVTIKLQTIRMNWQGNILNLIDTPGHVDFSYEVSRALAACEGAVLLVDATSGIQAQTLSHFVKAQELNLTIIPVVNKIDLPHAQIEETVQQISQAFSIPKEEVLYTSGKTGEGVENLLEKITKTIPPPSGKTVTPLRALIFDSFFDKHRGVVALVRVVDGELRKEKLQLCASRVEFEPIEIGYITADFLPSEKLGTGEVGYVATGIKEIQKCRVGDTITISKTEINPLPGYRVPPPMVFAHLFPESPGQFEKLRQAINLLSLNDASLNFAPISSKSLGPGFRGGFLGLFHLEIIQERLEREYAQKVFITNPEIAYQENQEPWVKAEIVTPQKFLGAVLALSQEHRGKLLEQTYLLLSKDVDSSTVHLVYEFPFAEIATDFFDRLKSATSGFASLDYEFLKYREANLVQLNILVNHEQIEELSLKTTPEKAEKIGRRLIEKLCELIPRQQFKIPLQAAIGGKIIARTDVPALHKNVTAKLYGGDRTRKDKLLQKQKEGKKRLKKFGQVEIPQEAFLTLLKRD